MYIVTRSTAKHKFIIDGKTKKKLQYHRARTLRRNGIMWWKENCCFCELWMRYWYRGRAHHTNNIIIMCIIYGDLAIHSICAINWRERARERERTSPYTLYTSQMLIELFQLLIYCWKCNGRLSKDVRHIVWRSIENVNRIVERWLWAFDYCTEKYFVLRRTRSQQFIWWPELMTSARITISDRRQTHDTHTHMVSREHEVIAVLPISNCIRQQEDRQDYTYQRACIRCIQL